MAVPIDANTVSSERSATDSQVLVRWWSQASYSSKGKRQVWRHLCLVKKKKDKTTQYPFTYKVIKTKQCWMVTSPNSFRGKGQETKKKLGRYMHDKLIGDSLLPISHPTPTHIQPWEWGKIVFHHLSSDISTSPAKEKKVSHSMHFWCVLIL